MNKLLATTEDIVRLAAVIPDNRALCELFDGKCRCAAEAEMMVAQTIHAAKLNAEKHDEPFSFEGYGIRSRSGDGLVDNDTAYSWLLDKGYFVNNQRQGRTVIFPTAKLVTVLDGFLAGKQKGKR